MFRESHNTRSTPEALVINAIAQTRQSLVCSDTQRMDVALNTQNKIQTTCKLYAFIGGFSAHELSTKISLAGPKCISTHVQWRDWRDLVQAHVHTTTYVYQQCKMPIKIT